MSKIVCIIPTRNNVDTLERAIRSAFNAGCDDVHVYNDATQDEGIHEIYLRLCETYKFPHLKMSTFSKDVRVGASAARNLAIQCYGMDWLIVCLDADDTLCDIAPLVVAWQPNTFIYGNHSEVNGDSITEHKGAPIKTLPNKIITGVTFLFAKSDWQKVRGFDVDFAFAEDYGFQCALVNAGVQGVYVDTTVYNRYIRPEGNERSVLAGQYWTFYRDMARRKYPNVWK